MICSANFLKYVSIYYRRIQTVTISFLTVTTWIISLKFQIEIYHLMILLILIRAHNTKLNKVSLK